MKCSRCSAVAEIALPRHHSGFCRDCFMVYFSRQVARAIKDQDMFVRSDRILVALSGGKDSLALFAELHEQGYDVTGLHVDLDIPGSSPRARAKVDDFASRLGAPLKVVELADDGLSIPQVRERVRRPICSSCGKIKRHWFNRVAVEEGFNVLATGHNLDDEAGRLLANTLRWDAAYLADQGPVLESADGFARKVKPLYRLTEFETAAYAFFKGIDIHKEPCPYSKGASFPVRKALLNRLEETSPGSKLFFYTEFLRSGRPAFAAHQGGEDGLLSPCRECGSPTSAGLCGVCRMRRTVAGEDPEEHDAACGGENRDKGQSLE